MNTRFFLRSVYLFGILMAILFATMVSAADRYIDETTVQTVIDDLTSQFGSENADRITRGVTQTAQYWQADDGSADDFAEFCRGYFAGDAVALQKTADRFEEVLARFSGHLGMLDRDMGWYTTVDTGPTLPVDYLFSAYSPWSHVNDDMFQTKIAFAVTLNFPRYNLKEKLAQGPKWSRNQWAQARLAEWFSARVPAEVSQKTSAARLKSGRYIDEYNVFMHHLLAPDGSRPFPEGMRLITHWNIRDELKAQYGQPDGLPKQQMIYELMLDIVRQDIPAAVINNPAVDWKMSTNEVTVSPVVDGDIPTWWTTDKQAGQVVDNSREPDTRYANWLGNFQAYRLVDPYYPEAPTMILRRFDQGREMTEAEVERLLVSIAESETVGKIGRLIEKRLGRKLQPFDIWYDGFKTRQAYSPEELDRIVNEKYPNVAAFQADLLRIFGQIGFSPETSELLASKIQVDPSRGIGHAAGPAALGDKAHLRTRVQADGMNYKGYNIAIHELGHNVEQVLSLYKIDHTLLSGVPITAITEAFAFTFQDRDMELLGLPSTDPNAAHLKTLDNIWGVYEIGGVSLVEMRVWRWLYDHPEANVEEFKQAVLAIAKDVWNAYFAPIFGVRDVEILAIYSHMIDGALYLPAYPMGSIIQFQIEQYLKKSGNVGAEIERMCSIGSVTPDLWMRTAVGSPISTEPLITAAEQALQALGD